jgi:hypothetical protein
MVTGHTTGILVSQPQVFDWGKGTSSDSFAKRSNKQQKTQKSSKSY